MERRKKLGAASQGQDERFGVFLPLPVPKHNKAGGGERKDRRQGEGVQNRANAVPHECRWSGTNRDIIGGKGLKRRARKCERF